MKKKIKYIFLTGIIVLFTVCESFCMADTVNNTITYNNQINTTYSNDVTTANITIPNVDSSLKVYDYADLFTREEEELLYEDVSKFIEKYNMDMVIVTINKNPNLSAKKYADSFYDTNNFGVGTQNDGILYLIDMDTRNIWITTTGSAIKTYEMYIDSMLDNYCYKYITKEQYYESADAFVKASEIAYKKHKKFNRTLKIVGTLFIALIVPTVFCLIKKGKHKQIKLAQDANQYLSNINILNAKDRFLTSHTTRVARQTSSSGSGGHSGGGGGVSHGGGGRSF